MFLVHKNVGLKQFWFQETFADLLTVSGVGDGVGGGVGLKGFSCQT